jgi:hypothetical protein
MQCSNGHECVSDDVFCRVCGEHLRPPLGGAPASVPTTVGNDQAASAPRHENGTRGSARANTARDATRRSQATGWVVVILTVCAGVGALLLVARQGGSTRSNGSPSAGTPASTPDATVTITTCDPGNIAGMQGSITNVAGDIESFEILAEVYTRDAAGNETRVFGDTAYVSNLRPNTSTGWSVTGPVLPFVHGTMTCRVDRTDVLNGNPPGE